MENQQDVHVKKDVGEDDGLFICEERYANVVVRKFCEDQGDPKRREKIVGESTEKELRELGLHPTHKDITTHHAA